MISLTETCSISISRFGVAREASGRRRGERIYTAEGMEEGRNLNVVNPASMVVHDVTNRDHSPDI